MIAFDEFLFWVGMMFAAYSAGKIVAYRDMDKWPPSKNRN